jgi:hypothetical protein
LFGCDGARELYHLNLLDLRTRGRVQNSPPWIEPRTTTPVLISYQTYSQGGVTWPNVVCDDNYRRDDCFGIAVLKE